MWLDEIEKFSAELRSVNERESRVRHPETEREQMARVLRELGELAKNAELFMLTTSTEAQDVYLSRITNNLMHLSDDAKELLK